MIPTPAATIALIGDVHEQWDADDAQALHLLGVDLVLFVGDFGNEAVEVVRSISQLPIPKAVALGNHDAWYSATAWGRKKCPYNRQQEDRVQQQLNLLGAAHVGFGWQDFPGLGLAVVGGRPFSWGGPVLQHADYLQERFGVASFAESTARILAAATQAQAKHLLMISHNGPTGLGESPESPCGRDWLPLGGDFGDPDLRAAITALQAQGRSIPLVAFGHMHHRLRHRQDRQRTILVEQNGTIYLNTAITPRIRKHHGQTWHGLMTLAWQEEQIHQIHQAWVNVQEQHIERHLLWSVPAPSSITTQPIPHPLQVARP